MTTSIELSPGELNRLKNYVLKTNLKRIPVKSEYEELRIRDGDIVLIFYKSGKLVHNETQGSLDVINAALCNNAICKSNELKEDECNELKEDECNELKEDESIYDYIIGTDETGKGEWYGPLVICCVVLTPNQIGEFRKLGVRDSKTLRRERLIAIAEKIIPMDFARKPLILMPETYNRTYAEFGREKKTLNDLMAWAHARLIKNMVGELKYKKVKIVIDKFDAKKTDFRLGNLDKTNLEIIQKSRGESEIPVAAASILAKYIFEKEVAGLNKKFGINLKKSDPGAIKAEILPFVAKTHFKNVRRFLG